jgi:tetratricopeptide (TPR) repeat protein
MPRQKSTHVDDPAEVGRRLKAARERAGLSQRQLAFSGCSPAYISRIESGDRIPSLQLLRELGGRLGVSEDYLAVGEDDSGDRQPAALVDAEVALRLDDLDGAEATYEAVLARSPSPASRADALAGLGEIAFRRADPHTAIELLEEARRLNASDELARPGVADTLGRAYATVGELESAIAVFERCLAVAEERQDVLEIIHFSVLLAYALVDAGNFGRAEELTGRALALGKDSANPAVRVQLYWSQSRLHLEQNDPETAARYARRALEILRLTEDTYRTARAYQLLAHIELDRGNAEEALELLGDGWPLLEQSGNRIDRAHFRIEEARALARLGRQEEAAGLAMELAGQLGDALPEDAARAYTILADVFAELEDAERAQELYELAVESLESRKPTRYLIDAYTKLAELLESTGRKEDAFELMKKALGAQRVLSEQVRP